MALRENRPHHANLTPEEKRQGIKRLEYRRSEVEEFKFGVGATDAELLAVVKPLHERVTSTLAEVFGDGTIECIQYVSDADASQGFLGDQLFGPGFYRLELLSLLNKALSFLTEEFDVATTGHPPGTPVNRYGGTRPDGGCLTSTVPGSKVFIVHGHDGAARHAAARFLEQLGLEAVILQEQSSQGRAIIEKFEDCAGEVGFAVVIMSPDDIAGPVAKPSSATRVRQNVIFELGYFSAKLGRGRTCVLREGDFEIPSDLYGLLYIELDDRGEWKLELAKELKAAGLKINAHGIL